MTALAKQPNYSAPAPKAGWQRTLSNALLVTQREVKDSFRDWRILAPIVILTFLFPFLAQFVAGQFTDFVSDFGAEIIGERTIPFLLMIVGFFPISISLVIALETFVGEKERKSLEPLLSTPLTNTELYIGKTLAAMIPPLVSSYGGMLVYLGTLVLGDLAWRPQFLLVLQIVLLTTVQALVMVTGAVVVSSQTTSTRAANLLASFIIIPMTLIIQGESAIMFLAPDAESPNGIGALWAIIFGMIVVVVLLLRVGNAIFNREELLGRLIDGFNLKATARNLWQHIRWSDLRVKTVNALTWYGQGVLASLRRVGLAFGVTALVYVLAFVGGYAAGQMPQYQLQLPTELPTGDVTTELDRASQFFFGEQPVAVAILVQNWRVLAGATVLAVFSFGIGALILTPLVYVIMGYLLSQIAIAGYDMTIFAAAILPHGVVEIPIILIATAVAVRLGAVVTRPPQGMTVGKAWMQALGDTARIWMGVIIPGLLLAALIEATITPIAVQWALGR
jgi:uncharacterized membrane protein SpoIIM required for sporulation/ABC-type transport system involved in multi-copper enzyme maturation permease subunit